MLALPASEAYSENLTCEGTFPNCKDILKLIVFILGVSATSLPEGAFYRLSLPPPIMGISAALFRETVYGSTDTDLDPRVTALFPLQTHRLQASALSTC